MPKHGFLTPKAIANRIKAKGLQKLRWYCQMCQKQCRDENGFKCHLTSESHQRQLLLFAENEDEFLDAFSQEFFDAFMELLRRRFGTRRVHCNVVYNEYIQDRDHIHMNSTKWETLTEFVKWLGREGFCTVDHTEKGWFVTYIDRDPETIRRQEELAKKKKMDLDDEERILKFVEKQIERAGGTSEAEMNPEYTELQRESEEEKITLNFSKASSSNTAKRDSEKKDKELLTTNALKAAAEKGKDGHKKREKEKRRSALDEIMEEEAKKKAKLDVRKDNWLFEGIVVKIVTKRLGERFHKKKGVVQEVKDLYTAVVRMLDSGTKIKVDQIHVETVIPNIGRRVMIVNGHHRGCKGSLLALDDKNFSVSVKLESGPLKGETVDGIKYEDISKVHIPNPDTGR